MCWKNKQKNSTNKKKCIDHTEKSDLMQQDTAKSHFKYIQYQEYYLLYPMDLSSSLLT